MGCNCKNDKNEEGLNEEKDFRVHTLDSSTKTVGSAALVMVVKIFMFLIAVVIASIVILPFSIYLLYKTIFMEESIDLTGAILAIGKSLKKKDDDEYDDDDDDDDEEDEEDEEEDGYEFEDEEEIVLLDKDK